MKKEIKRILVATLFLVLTFCLNACNNKTTGEEKGSRLPDYDKMKDKSVILNAWYSPTPTDDNFRLYKEAGFDYLFVQGDNVGTLGDKRIEDALDLCDKYGIKAFIDSGDQINNTFEHTELLNHESFVGFNIDEPILEHNTINNKQGIRDIGQYLESFENIFEGKDFLVNLNPFDCFHVFQTDYSYDEYIEGVNDYIISNINKGNKWLSADSYVLRYAESGKNKLYLLDTWLYQLDLMAHFKAENEGVKTNMFIQSISYTPIHERPEIKKEDLKMQLLCCLAFNFDMISYYCYACPVGHFNAPLDFDENPTVMYDYTKELNPQIKDLSMTVKQFGLYMGAYTGLGTNNLEKDEYYDNKTLVLKQALSLNKLGEIANVSASEDYLITHLKDDNNNSGYMVINYNETSKGLNNIVNIEFKNATKAVVYHDGTKEVVDLKNHVLTLELSVGDGAFVIPDYY